MRPSKAALWTQFHRDMLEVSGKPFGLDAGAADLKCYPLFSTETYWGIDIGRESLERGLGRYPDAKAILADLSTVPVPANSVDVCVSTNTLFQLDVEPRLSAIRTLCQAVKPDGIMMIELNNDEAIEQTLKLLQDNFSQLDISYFGNKLSRLYEKILQRSDGKMPGYAGSRPFLAISWILSRLEIAGRKTSTVRNQIYIKAQGKIAQGKPVLFDAKLYEPIGDRLYEPKQTTQ